MVAVRASHDLRRRRPGAGQELLVIYAVLGSLAATGGARPTGIGIVDAAMLGAGGVAMAACARRSRTIPVYLAAAVTAICQPAGVPLGLAIAALVTAFGRRHRLIRLYAGTVAGGLAWAAAVGAPFSSSARPLWAPLALMAWVVVSARTYGSARFRIRLTRVAIGVGAAAAASAALGILPMLNANVQLNRGSDLLELGLEAARAGDTVEAVADLAKATDALRAGESSLSSPWALPARLVPGLSQNARAMHAVSRDLARLSGVAIAAAQEADLAALGMQSGQVDLAAVELAEAPLDDVLHQLEVTRDRLEEAGDSWLVPPVRDRLEAVAGAVGEAIPSAQRALAGVRATPALLGADGSRSYLVLFTTPTEARGAGGIPVSFAEVRITDGRFQTIRFGRISELDAGGVPGGQRVVDVPDDYLARYGRFGSTQQWRNITLSPDFPAVARVAAQLYPQSGGAPVDGVMALDPVALGALMTFTGPVTVPGLDEPITPQDAADLLLRDQYLSETSASGAPDLLETVPEIVLDRLSTVDLPGPHVLAKVLGPVAAGGHLTMVTVDDVGLGFLEHLGLTGALPGPAGDALNITTNNVVGSKVDLFLRRSVDYDVTWDPTTRSIRSVLRIELENSAPSAGLSEALIGSSLDGGQAPAPGTNRTYLSVFTPLQLERAEVDGQPLLVESQTEGGRSVYSTFLELAPDGGRATLELVLAGTIPGAGGYHLEIVPQVLAVPDQLHVRVSQSGRVVLDAGPDPFALRSTFDT